MSRKYFNVFFSHVHAHYRVLRYYTGLNFLWVIDNNADVSSAMDRISKKGNARSVSTFDFSTLYTKIPHNKLLQRLQFFIDLVFNDKDRKYLSCTDLEPTGFLVQDVLIEGTLRTRCHLLLSF